MLRNSSQYFSNEFQVLKLVYFSGLDIIDQLQFVVTSI